MNYDQAADVVKSNYAVQAPKLLSSLSQEAIITLAGLCNQNIIRQISDFTIFRISSMEPHRQSGYLANPFLQMMLDSCTESILNPKPVEVIAPRTVVIGGKKSNKNNIKVPDPIPVQPLNKPKPEPEPEPEPIDDDGDDVDDPTLFNLFG